MENKVYDKICTTAFTLAVIGVCIIGVCPAFGMMAIAIAIVLRAKNVQLSSLNKSKISKAVFLGIVSLVMFVVDLVIAFAVFG